MSAYQAAGDIWVQLFSCCINEPAQQQKRQRRRIDRSMIGEPTNFRHTGHIGSEDVENSRLWAIQNQMQSKGGYENPHSTVKVSLGGVIEQKIIEEDHISQIAKTTMDHQSTHREESTNSKMAQPNLENAAWMDFERVDTGDNVKFKHVTQKKKPVKFVVSNLMMTFAEAFSKVAALPISVAIALVNKVSNATNSTLYVSGEITKLPVTITNSIIQELSNITYPN